MTREESPLIPDVLDTCATALERVDDLVLAATRGVGEWVLNDDGRIDADALESDQMAAHGLAWFATYAGALRQMLAWARRLEADERLSELEALMVQAAFGEYIAQMIGGLPISQGEIVRPADMGVDTRTVHGLFDEAVSVLRHRGNSAAVQKRIAWLAADGNHGAWGLDDETLDLVRDQFRRFTEDQVVPNAQDWHLNDELIPMELVEQMAEMGVFGLTVPEEHGGLGMGKTAMCVVTEELSRGWIGVGSLGTRSEIAAELIRLGGTEDQKAKWLPGIATGEVLPTAVFTEPNTGSDLASLRTRATRDGDGYTLTGAKTWITHAARSDLMTLLARTNPDEPGYKGLSMFLAEKPRGTEDDPFPAEGMSGTEIPVLGYRGMKEYELGFDGFRVPEDALLGGEEGQGFKHLMATFESARVQTAARAVGVGQAALEAGMQYTQDRSQFGKPLYSFPRVACKLAWMIVETMIARQLTLYAANEKDSGRRCDVEAGMAKLLAARVAWANADNAVQVHGGNGYAMEYPVSRLLVDARILNIFEGAAEIQAHVIARGLLRPKKG